MTKVYCLPPPSPHLDPDVLFICDSLAIGFHGFQIVFKGKLVLKPSSHIVLGSIWLYSVVLQYPRTTIWKHSDQILNTVKYPQYRQISLGIANRTRLYSQYREIPSVTLGNCWQVQPYGNTSDIQVFDGIWVANIKYRILSNTAKYYMGSTHKG